MRRDRTPGARSTFWRAAVARDTGLLRRALDIDDFLASPVGRCFAGRTFVIWVFAPDLLGNAYFGCPDADDLSAIARMYDLPRHPALAPPYDFVIDCGGLTAIELDPYQAFAAYAASYLPAFAPLVRRGAIVRPSSGPQGTMLTGLFHELIRSQIAAELFVARASAFASLGRHDAGDAHAAVDAAVEQALGGVGLLDRLRELLRRDPARARLDDAARRLGVSERSLQRRLREAGTSFRNEVDGARIAAAQALLAGSDAKLEVVARRLGYSSLPHFSRCFRRVTGEAPRTFRRPRAR